MNHYYTPNPGSDHDIIAINYRAKGTELRFTTDAGVFSRRKVDYGSDFLIHSLPALDGRVLDLGCGYGPIGISLASLNPGIEMIMTDINQRAVTLAQKNIRANRIINAEAFESDGFSNIAGTFAVIASNPPVRAGKCIIYSLLEQSYDFLAPKGNLWLVIQKKQGASSMAAKLESVFSNCTVEDKAKGYWLLHSIKQ